MYSFGGQYSGNEISPTSPIGSTTLILCQTMSSTISALIREVKLIWCILMWAREELCFDPSATSQWWHSLNPTSTFINNISHSKPYNNCIANFNTTNNQSTNNSQSYNFYRRNNCNHFKSIEACKASYNSSNVFDLKESMKNASVFSRE